MLVTCYHFAKKLERKGAGWCAPDFHPLQDAIALVIRGYLREGARVHQPKARNETGRRTRFYVALGLATAATLMLQIIEMLEMGRHLDRKIAGPRSWKKRAR